MPGPSSVTRITENSVSSARSGVSRDRRPPSGPVRRGLAGSDAVAAARLWPVATDTRTAPPVGEYFRALSTRFWMTWRIWSRSPTTRASPRGGRSRLTATRRSAAIRASASATSLAAAPRSQRPSGRMCSFSSMRDRDIRSSTRRAMRSAWTPMMPRNRSRACSSSRAWPRRVSMKPDREASGVRSSWLALARKSARIRSLRRTSVSSRITSTQKRRGSRCSRGAVQTRQKRSWAPPVSKLTLAFTPPNRLSSTASSTSGRRMADRRRAPSRGMRSSVRAAALAKVSRLPTRSSGSSAEMISNGSGRVSSASSKADRRASPGWDGGAARLSGAERSSGRLRQAAQSPIPATQAATRRVGSSRARPVAARTPSPATPAPVAIRTPFPDPSGREALASDPVGGGERGPRGMGRRVRIWGRHGRVGLTAANSVTLSITNRDRGRAKPWVIVL